VSHSPDGYESEAWRRHNRRLNRLRRADKQHRKATSLASRRNASKKRKEAGDQESVEMSGGEEKRLRKMSLADGDSSAGR
jgi:hypothetical protein